MKSWLISSVEDEIITLKTSPPQDGVALRVWRCLLFRLLQFRFCLLHFFAYLVNSGSRGPSLMYKCLASLVFGTGCFIYRFNLKKFKFIYVFGCAGSLSLHGLFSSCREGATLQ